jgi:hypothetical protein
MDRFGVAKTTEPTVVMPDDAWLDGLSQRKSCTKKARVVEQVRVCAACEPWSIALIPPDWRFPTEVLDDVRLVFPSQVQVPTHCGGRAVGSGAFHEGATSMGVSGFGDRALTASLPTGIC